MPSGFPTIRSFPSVNFIDDEVLAKLRKFNILPSPAVRRCRVSAQGHAWILTGRIPPAGRVREFLADSDPRKREKLIEVLLDSPEFVDYWTFRLADLFRVAVFPVGINPKWSQSYWEWIRDAVARNRPYDRVAEERIAAQGYSPASRHYLPYLVLPPPENMMGEEVRVFMGRRLDCAQCHDHPYEQWTQDQFWGMAAFFGSMFRLGANPESVVFDSPDGREVAADVPSPTELRVLHPRTGQEVAPTLLNGTRVSFSGPGFPRGELAKWITSHAYFAEASVNRFWSYFFGRGIVDPVDDFRSNNAPTHPELLRRLAEDFARNGYDLRHLFRRIVNSRTYQLSSAVNHIQPGRPPQLLPSPEPSPGRGDPAGCHLRRDRGPRDLWQLASQEEGKRRPPQGNARRPAQGNGHLSVHLPGYLRASQPVLHSGAGRQVQSDPGPAPAGGIDLQRQALDRGGSGL